MNKTRQITTVAMLLAITEALTIINRYIGYIFSDILPILPISIIWFLSKNKDFNTACFYGITVVLTSFMFSNGLGIIYTITLIVPTLIITKLFSNKRKKIFLTTTFISYFIVEFLDAEFILPLFGIEISKNAQLLFELTSNASLSKILYFIAFLNSLAVIAILEEAVAFMLFSILDEKIKS